MHEMAEELVHVSSKKLVDRLDEFLGFPKSDPHGDPIPDSNGKVPLKKQMNLTENSNASSRYFIPRWTFKTIRHRSLLEQGSSLR